jgi:hypothetical protein
MHISDTCPRLDPAWIFHVRLIYLDRVLTALNNNCENLLQFVEKILCWFPKVEENAWMRSKNSYLFNKIIFLLHWTYESTNAQADDSGHDHIQFKSRHEISIELGIMNGSNSVVQNSAYRHSHLSKREIFQKGVFYNYLVCPAYTNGLHITSVPPWCINFVTIQILTNIPYISLFHTQIGKVANQVYI